MPPLFSVIVPVYERREFLRECLESITSQWEEGKFEVLVLDNASPTPGLKELVDDIGKGKVLFVRNKRNLGLYGSVNRGIALTTGQYVHVLHEDDYVLPGFYEEVVFLKTDKAAVFHTHYLNVLPDGNNGGPPFITSQNDLLERLVLGNPLQVCSVVIDRLIFNEIGNFREDLPHVADWEFWMRSALRFPWIYNKKPMAVFRIHKKQDSVEHTDNGRAIYDTRRLLDSFAEILPDNLKAILPKARRSYARLAAINAAMALERGDSAMASIFLREADILLRPTSVGANLVNS